MIRISRPLPGEIAGDINPEDFGFDVIEEEPLTAEEEAQIKASLYRDTKERTGIVIPELEPYLSAVGARSADTDPKTDPTATNAEDSDT